IDLAAFSDKVRIEMVPLTGIGRYVPFASMSYSKALIEAGYNDAVEYLDAHTKRPEVAPVIAVDPAIATVPEGS
ncbi:MAG: hypothetical protein M3290_00660, partial [Actinomycetota bacterium]|nr:hypothetical protein [Actinomycetota bacterium]